jgi:hypothetical protein
MLHVRYRPYEFKKRVWCRVPLAESHPFVHHRSSTNYLKCDERELRARECRLDESQESQDVLLRRTAYKMRRRYS